MADRTERRVVFSSAVSGRASRSLRSCQPQPRIRSKTFAVMQSVAKSFATSPELQSDLF
jgi:hypothetical protein